MKYDVYLLDDDELLGVILLCNSGVVYHNQVGGVMCQQEQAEGALIPFDQLKTFKPPHDNYNCGGINSDEFDEYFEESNQDWRVDRSRHSVEAWVYVTDGTHKGIFTYSNCD